GHVTLANAVPVPTVALDGVTPITSDAQLADPSLVGAGNTIDPDWAHSWWSIHPQSTMGVGQPVIIDGYTQGQGTADLAAYRNTSPSGDNAILRIEVNGSQLPAGWINTYQYTKIGFNLSASNCTFTGVVFNGVDTPDPTSGFPSGTSGAHATSFVFNCFGAQN